MLAETLTPFGPSRPEWPLCWRFLAAGEVSLCTHQPALGTPKGITRPESRGRGTIDCPVS